MIKKREQTFERIKFITKCRTADIIPRFLRFRIPENGCFEPTMVHNFQRKLLNQELKRAKDQLCLHNESIDRVRKEVRESVPSNYIPSIVFNTRHIIYATRSTVNERHQRKLQNLSTEQHRPLFNVQDTVKLHNIDVIPPQYVMDTLALGPRNAVVDKFVHHNVLAELDLLLNKCERDKVPNDIINDINIALVKYIKQCQKQRVPRNLKLTKLFLKKHDLIAVPFDKGTGFCVMKSSEYQEKIMEILSLSQFEKITTTRRNAKEPTIKEHERIINVLTGLKDEGKLDAELCQQLKPCGSQPPRLYGLAKVHKASIPVRPVLSMPGSAYYKVAKQVADWMSVIPEAQINSSSKKIADQIKTLELNDEEQMVSFDVSALYTNVPVNEAIKLAADRLYAGDLPTPPVDKETFVKLTEISSLNVIMSTHQGYYKQIDGLAMGAPPAPYLANIWLSSFDTTIKGDSRVYQRYMDDILTTIRKHELANKLDKINLLHPNLTFTSESEVDGRLPFLDLCIVHTNNDLYTTWYTKPTDTGLIMNFHAIAPRRYKRAVVQGFVYRIFRACSNWKAFDDSICRAKQVLERNQYPPEFYDAIINQTLEKIIMKSVPSQSTAPAIPATTTTTASPKSYILRLQYRGRETDNLIRQLNKVSVPIRPVLTLRKLNTIMPSLKPSVPLPLRNRVVYHIECPGCQASYVGSTVRHLHTRFAEHRNINKPVGAHFAACIGRKPEWDDIKILVATTCTEDYLRALEALYINEVRPTLNTHDDYNSRVLTLRF